MSATPSRPSTLAPANEHPPLYLGLEHTHLDDLQYALLNMRRADFDYLTAPLCDPERPSAPWLATDPPQPSPPPIDDSTPDIQPVHENLAVPSMLDNTSNWSNNVVGEVGPLDWSSPLKDLERIIVAQTQWAAHLSLPSILFPVPPTEHVANYAQIVNAVIQKTVSSQFWIRIPLCDSESATAQPETEAAFTTDPWQRWNTLRVLCGHARALSPAVIITPDLPSKEVLDVWTGEPIRCGILPVESFTTDRKGRPTLSAAHRNFVTELFRLRAQLIVSGDTSKTQGGAAAYSYYLRTLQVQSLHITRKDQFEEPYYDYLQSPLQPLADNLECQTYETFEKDPVKYRQYEQAVFEALCDRPEDKVHVLMVLGAGRGPLILSSLRAGRRSNRKLRIFAVEKNPNAVIILKNLKRRLCWTDEQVSIVDSDMRSWKAPVKADIIVSELLGSFGDNELSPECLDGAQHLLAPGGISIPSSYTNQIAPITSEKLWNEVRAFGSQRKHFETDYVVMLHNMQELAPAQNCFTFVHPNLDEPIDNTRYVCRTFKVKSAALLHGVAGYFDATLYKKVHVSINPATFSAGMISWFPLLFPIQTPLFLPTGAIIQLHFWRRVSSTKVWYEWCVTSEHGSTPIHNVNGRSHGIGLHLDSK